MHITKHRLYWYLSLLITFTLLPIKIYLDIGDISKHMYTSITYTYVCRYFCIYFLRCDHWRPWFYIDIYRYIKFISVSEFSYFLICEKEIDSHYPLYNYLFDQNVTKSLVLLCFVCSPRWLQSEILLFGSSWEECPWNSMSMGWEHKAHTPCSFLDLTYRIRLLIVIMHFPLDLHLTCYVL